MTGLPDRSEMSNIIPIDPRERRQLAAFALFSIAAVGAAGALLIVGAGSFLGPYFGAINPALVFGGATVAGVVCLRALQASGWVKVQLQSRQLGLGEAAAVAALLAIPAVIVDWFVGIEVANVAMPWSLLFYPSMALVAEITFHLAPLALWALGSGTIARANPESTAFVGLFLVSLLEPTYQLWSGLAHRSLSLLDGYVWAQVWAVNLVQLHLFRRFGFTSMCAARLVSAGTSFGDTCDSPWLATLASHHMDAPFGRERVGGLAAVRSCRGAPWRGR